MKITLLKCSCACVCVQIILNVSVNINYHTKRECICMHINTRLYVCMYLCVSSCLQFSFLLIRNKINWEFSKPLITIQIRNVSVALLTLKSSQWFISNKLTQCKFNILVWVEFTYVHNTNLHTSVRAYIYIYTMWILIRC